MLIFYVIIFRSIISYILFSLNLLCFLYFLFFFPFEMDIYPF